jgi:hypothetical protein
LIITSAIFWQLNKNNATVRELITLQYEQQQWNKIFEQKLENANLKILAEKTPEVEPISIEKPAELSKQLISLIDDYGTVVASNLILNIDSTTEYIGTTTSGYSITVNLNGDVGSPLGMRYFQNDDCSGDAYINSQSAVIYRDNKNIIWYVEKLAPVVTMKASSSKNQIDECLISGDELIRVRLLERDFNMVTGIDDPLRMSLYFAQ